MTEFDNKYNQAKEWLDSFTEANSILPNVIEIYQDFTKHKTLFDEIPETEKNLKINLEEKLLEPLSLFVDSLGPKPEINIEGLSFSGATASSGSAFVLEEVVKYNAADSEWKKRYRSETFKMIEEIQDQRASIEFIIEKLEYLHPPLAKEFEELTELNHRYIASLEFSSSFGIKLRNVIEHFRGICNKAAIKLQGKELKGTEGLSWIKISENIALSGRGSKYDKEFQKNSSIYTKLHNELSSDAKDYSVDDIQKLKDAFITLVQYLKSCLQLINIEEIKKSIL